MKKRFALLLLISFSCLLLAGCPGKLYYGENSIQRVERLTGYDLPDDMEELYDFRDETFTGCAGQYSVYALAEAPSCIRDKKEDRDEKLSADEVARITDYLDENGIPTEYYPDFTRTYTYITGAEDTYLLYFPEDGQLIIWMHGH